MDMVLAETFNEHDEIGKLGCYNDLRVSASNCGSHYHGKLGCYGWLTTCSKGKRTIASAKQGFSAACYFAAAHFKGLDTNESKRPVGLLWDSVGGTKIQTWMSIDAVSKCVVNASGGDNWDYARQLADNSVGTVVWYQVRRYNSHSLQFTWRSAFITRERPM